MRSTVRSAGTFSGPGPGERMKSDPLHVRAERLLRRLKTTDYGGPTTLEQAREMLREAERAQEQLDNTVAMLNMVVLRLTGKSDD